MEEMGALGGNGEEGESEGWERIIQICTRRQTPTRLGGAWRR